MPPPPARLPKRKQIVLDEDEWTSKMEAIIERDFFPELPKLEAKLQWLEVKRPCLHVFQNDIWNFVQGERD